MSKTTFQVPATLDPEQMNPADLQAHFDQLDHWQSSIRFYRDIAADYQYWWNQPITEAAACVRSTERPNMYNLMLSGAEGIEGIKACLEKMCHIYIHKAVLLETEMSAFAQGDGWKIYFAWCDRQKAPQNQENAENQL